MIDLDAPLDWLQSHTPHLSFLATFLAWIVKDALEEARKTMWDYIKGLLKKFKSVGEGELIDRLTMTVPFLTEELDKIKADPNLTWISMNSHDQAVLFVSKIQDYFRKKLQGGTGK